MSFAKYAQFYKDNGFFAGSKIKATVTDNSFIGQEMVLSKGTDVIQTRTIPVSGLVEFFTDESGELTLSSDNGTSTISGSVEVTNYATYNVTLNGASSDNTREVYADKDSVTLDDDTTSETINISYTGDKASLAVKSSNTNVATATLNDNKVTISDTDKGFKGTSNVVVSVMASNEYPAKDFTIKVTKTNGEIDKSWIGLKNIVETEQEKELCEIGEEYSVTLSTGETLTYIIGAINNDYPHQLLFIPKNSTIKRAVNHSAVSSGLPWGQTSLRAWLNDDFEKTLPSDIREVISERYIETPDNATTLSSVSDKVFIPRIYEVLGTIPSGGLPIEQYASNIHQFKCFADKLINTGTSDTDALQTCSYASSSYYWIVSKPSSAYTQKQMTMTVIERIYPCFHIIKDS